MKPSKNFLCFIIIAFAYVCCLNSCTDYHTIVGDYQYQLSAKLTYEYLTYSGDSAILNFHMDFKDTLIYSWDGDGEVPKIPNELTNTMQTVKDSMQHMCHPCIVALDTTILDSLIIKAQTFPTDFRFPVNLNADKTIHFHPWIIATINGEDQFVPEFFIKFLVHIHKGEIVNEYGQTEYASISVKGRKFVITNKKGKILFD